MSKLVTCALVLLAVFLFFTQSHKASAPSYAENSPFVETAVDDSGINSAATKWDDEENHSLSVSSYAAFADSEGQEEEEHDEYSSDLYGTLNLDVDAAKNSKFSGTTTIDVYNPRSGNSYSLEADVNDGQVERIYFPNGGWSDISSSDVSFGSGTGTDTEGREWEFDGVPPE